MTIAPTSPSTSTAFAAVGRVSGYEDGFAVWVAVLDPVALTEARRLRALCAEQGLDGVVSRSLGAAVSFWDALADDLGDYDWVHDDEGDLADLFADDAEEQATECERAVVGVDGITFSASAKYGDTTLRSGLIPWAAIDAWVAAHAGDA